MRVVCGEQLVIANKVNVGKESQSAKSDVMPLSISTVGGKSQTSTSLNTVNITYAVPESSIHVAPHHSSGHYLQFFSIQFKPTGHG